MEAKSRKLPAAPSKIGRHGEYESPKKAVAPIRRGSDPAAQKVIRATPKTNAAGQGSLASRPVASTREPNSTSVGAGGGTPSCTSCRSGEVKGATRTQQASDLVSRACGCRVAVNKATSSAIATTPAGMQRFSPETDRRTLARVPARAKTSPCARSARRNAPVQVDPLALCLAQQSAGEWPPVDVLPVATLNSALPTPEILDGYEGPPPMKSSIAFGVTPRIGAAAIIVPKTVNPKSFERVLFWMQGEQLPTTDSAFLASLSVIAQSAGAMVVVLRTEQNVPIPERAKIYSAFVATALKGGVTVLRTGVEERIEIAKDATYILGGWSRGATAAIAIAARTVSGAKIPTTRGRLKGVIAVGPSFADQDNEDQQFSSSVLSEAARKNLRALDALFVVSYADADTFVRGSRYFSSFGTGAGRAVLLTATCQNHKKLFGLTVGDPTCTLGSPANGGFYANVISPAPPDCAETDLGPYWSEAAVAMFDWSSPNSTTTFDRFFRQEIRIDPVARVQMLARGSVRGALEKSVSRIATASGVVIPTFAEKCDGTGGNLRDIIGTIAPNTPLVANGCPIIVSGGKIAGLNPGAMGKVFLARAGTELAITMSSALESWRLRERGIARISFGIVDISYFSDSAAGQQFPDQGPRTSALRMCYQARPASGAKVVASGAFFIESAPVYQTYVCGINDSTCAGGTNVLVQRGGQGGLILQSATFRLPPRMGLGIASVELSFRPNRSFLVVLGALESVDAYP